MTRVAILTPDPAEIAYPELWPKVLARLQRALDEVGVCTVPTPWTGHVDSGSVNCGKSARNNSSTLGLRPLTHNPFHAQRDQESDACPCPD